MVKLARIIRKPGFAVTAFLLTPIGSIEDRLILSALLLSARTPWVRSLLRRVRARVGSEILQCLLLSLASAIWAWANARPRLGQGPFHIVDVAGVWRGYPFLFEEWVLNLNPAIRTWREIQWLGLIGNVAILFCGLIWIARCFPESRVRLLTVFPAVLSGVLVWLNIDVWVNGVPITLSWPTILSSSMTRGYPWPYQAGNDTRLRALPIAANVVAACVSWSVLTMLLAAYTRGMLRAAPGQEHDRRDDR